MIKILIKWQKFWKKLPIFCTKWSRIARLENSRICFGFRELESRFMKIDDSAHPSVTYNIKPLGIIVYYLIFKPILFEFLLFGAGAYAPHALYFIDFERLNGKNSNKKFKFPSAE